MVILAPQNAQKVRIFGYFFIRADQSRIEVTLVRGLVLFIVDLMVPDFIPFADEILLGLATVILGNWKQRKKRKSEKSKPS